MLLDAIGLSTDEEREATELVRFVTIGLDSVTILFSSDCSCILFAILSLMHLSKLRFLAQQRELKWLMLNKQRRLFHSSGVKCPLVNMSAIWCLVSVYRIWILESKSIPSNNQPRETVWASGYVSHSWTPALDYHFDHGFVVFKHVQHRDGLGKFDVRKHTISVKQLRTIVLGWNFGLILLSCARHDAMPQVSLCWWIIGFTWLRLQWNTSIPQFQRSKAGIPSIP